MGSAKPILFMFIGLALAANATRFGPPETASDVPTAVPPIDYRYTPHARAVAAICHVATDKKLCCHTLRPIPSDDPRDLVAASVVATEAAMNKSIEFILGLKPRYEADATATTCLNVCEKQLGYAVDDLLEFKQQVGRDIVSLAKNYSVLLDLVRKVYTSQSGCMDDILDEKLLKTVQDGIAVGTNLSSNAVDILYNLRDVFNAFSLKVDLI